MRSYRHPLRLSLLTVLGVATVALADAPVERAPRPGAPTVAPVRGAWRWDSRDEFDQCYRNRYLDSETNPGAAQLSRGIVVTDDMGQGYNEFQPIRGKTQARKILVIEDPDVSAATLFIGGSVKGCDLVVNGTVLGSEPLERSYWHADFERYVIPPKLLKKGENEFVFRARDDKSSGSIRIEISQQPDRSAASRDGGHSWDSDHLAEGGFCNGELQVRLNLERFAPQAWLRSPVIDLAARPGQLPAAAPAPIADLVIDAQTPPGTSVAAFVRTGETPDGYEENWSRWHAWPAEREQLNAGNRENRGRFAQWQLVLKTGAAQKTPVVKRVELATGPNPQQAGASPFKSISTAGDDNEVIVRSSYDFAYADYDRNSRQLRDHFKLADVVASPSSEFEKLQAMRQWVREQWKDGWNWGPLHYIPSWDARVILSMAPQNLSLGMCTHYATTYVQCSSALGYTSRSIFRGHALSESWSNEHRKWMVMDAGMDPNDRRRATYHFERESRPGVPLSELEAHKAYWIDKNWQDIRLVTTNMSEGTEKVEEPFYADAQEVLKGMQEIFLPLRNNFIDHREPEEPEHGQGYFKFMGFLLWKDPSTPEVGWTDFFTTREADLYWTLNQAQLFLREPAADGTVPVILDTVTPNFAGYQWRIDGREWQTWTPLAAVEGVKAWPMQPTGGCIELPWKLHTGRNTIEARPVNKAGHEGIVSRMVVEAE